MPVSAYRYAGAVLAQAQSVFDPQKDNMGMLELNIDGLVPGGKEILTLSLQEFTVPGREVNVGELPYLNGRSRYAQAPNALGNISVTYRDFPAAGTRRVLREWFSFVYDERTGLQLPMSIVKKIGHLVLFQSDGTGERTARLEGVFPVKEPEVAINYGGGEALLMAMEFSVDIDQDTGADTFTSPYSKRIYRG